MQRNSMGPMGYMKVLSTSNKNLSHWPWGIKPCVLLSKLTINQLDPFFLIHSPCQHLLIDVCLIFAGTWNSSDGPTGDSYHHHKAGLSYSQQHGHYHTPETTCTGSYERSCRNSPFRKDRNQFVLEGVFLRWLLSSSLSVLLLSGVSAGLLCGCSVVSAGRNRPEDCDSCHGDQCLLGNGEGQH